jgi:hypothetical protein
MIFISYCWRDSDSVRPYVQLLEDLGLELWIDYKGLTLQSAIEPQIAFAIKQADSFLLFDSDYARASSWVRFEVELARLFCIPTNAVSYSGLIRRAACSLEDCARVRVLPPNLFVNAGGFDRVLTSRSQGEEFPSR